ncbi:MAG: hypothetical protein D6767_06575 [Candidatus Hydrogenedentota bacterium]|nr:MAG: hypothetical protein D6767_06575 [Candidatus Hydrogenedentota bacterium]
MLKNWILGGMFPLLLLFSCKNANKIANEGIEYLNAGNYIAALNAFDEALEIDKENVLALYGRARIYAKNSETREMAKRDLEKALPHLKSPEDELQARIVLANIYYQYNQWKKAISVLEDAYQKGRREKRLLLHLSQYYAENRQISKAKEVYEKALQQYASDEDILYSYGLFLAKYLHQYKKATDYLVQSLEKAKEKGVFRYDTVLNLVKLAYLQRQYNQAFALLQELEKNIPDQEKGKIAELKKKIQTRTWRVKL